MCTLSRDGDVAAGPIVFANVTFGDFTVESQALGELFLFLPTRLFSDIRSLCSRNKCYCQRRDQRYSWRRRVSNLEFMSSGITLDIWHRHFASQIWSALENTTYDGSTVLDHVRFSFLQLRITTSNTSLDCRCSVCILRNRITSPFC